MKETVVLVSPDQDFLSNPSMSEPLGLMHIEGALKELGVETKMVDMSFDTEIPEADIYAFSASTIHYPQVLEYRKRVGNSFTVIGGPHASAMPEEVIKHFDAVVVGPGEKAIRSVMENFRRGIKEIIYRAPIDDIDLIPHAPRTILKRIEYNVVSGPGKSATILTSRGCPHRCAFCASNVIWGRYVKYHSVKWIIDEVMYLINEFNIEHFKFVDDVFTLNKSRFKILAKQLSGLGIKWLCEIRADNINDEILKHMIKNGCDCVNLGVESVDDIVLKGIRKGIDSSTMKKAIAKIKSKGLKIKIYLICGLPFEPENIVQQTIDFIEETQPDLVSIFTFVPYPGTDVWLNPQNYNIKRVLTDFSKYQHSIGEKENEFSELPNVEYNNRTREEIRDQRNILKEFSIDWNERNN